MGVGSTGGTPKIQKTVLLSCFRGCVGLAYWLNTHSFTECLVMCCHCFPICISKPLVLQPTPVVYKLLINESPQYHFTQRGKLFKWPRVPENFSERYLHADINR